jgi:transposase
MKAYSLDLRQKVVEVYQAGGVSQRQLAKQFHVSLFFVRKMLRLKRLGSNLAPRERRGWQKSLISPAIRHFVEQNLNEQNDLTLLELSERVESQFGVKVSRATLCRVVKRADLRHKKS